LNKLNSITNTYKSNLTSLNTSADLLYRHKFETIGRTLSIGLGTSYRKDKGDKMLFSENIFYEDVLTSDTVDQISKPDIKGIGASSNIVYTEPVSETGILQFNSRFSYSEDESDQKTFTSEGSSSTLDSSLSNVYKKVYQTQSFGTGYRYQKDELTLMGNITYAISQIRNNQYFPQSFNTKKTFQSLLPFLSLRYKISSGQHLNIFYRTFSTDPRVEQLQNVLNNSNPVQLSIGNPDLKQDYRHMFVLRYSQMNIENLNSFFVLFGGSVVSNYIGNNSIIAGNDTTVDGILLQRGTQLTKPVNLDGYTNLHSFLTYGLPIGFVESNLNFNIMLNYTRTPGIINGINNYSNSLTYGLGLIWSSNISEELDFTFSSNSSFNDVKNSAQENYNGNYLTQTTGLRAYWSFWEGLLFLSELNHVYDSGLSEGYNKNSLQWNLSIGKKLFNEEQGELRFSVSDILNQSTNTRHSTTDLYAEDTKSNVLGRYFMLSFIYDIKTF
jgi:hypothetical protein